jgi:hypothetical protein
MPGPDFAASSSVAFPIRAAVGITPSAAAAKMIGADACSSSRVTAAGMNAASR